MSILSGLGLSLLGLLLTAAAGAGIFYALFSQSFPSLETFASYYNNKPSPTRFFARDGETLLFTLAYENFETQTLSVCETQGEGCFPKTFLEAARLTRENLSGRSKDPLAEDMVKTVYAKAIGESSRPELLTKILSYQIRQTYGEDQLTAWYYNNAWFGQMAFGLDAAARLYLDKSAESLSDAECVLMSAIVNAPMLNPIDSKGALRDFYLSQLADLQRAGLFDESQADVLARSNFIIFEPPQYANAAEPDLITQKALNALVNQFGRETVERGGITVITSEDAAIQGYLNCITSEENNEENSSCPLSAAYSDREIQNAAESLRTAPVSIAIIDVNNGQILAELEGENDSSGTRTYSSSLNHYPIGTTMNIFAALTAFKGGSSPSTLLWDLENEYASKPENPDNETYHGPIQLREALTQDYLRPLTAHLQQFGSGAVQRNASLFGLSGSMLSEQDLLKNGGSFTAEAVAYSLLPFAALGEQRGSAVSGVIQPVSILQIERETGETEFPQAAAQKVLIADNLAYLVHNVFTQETGDLALPDRPSAAKIGQAAGDSGLWISGYTANLSCAIRLADSGKISAFVTDGDRIRETAEILWQSVMEQAHRGRPVSGWEIPSDVSQVRICLPSGKLPTKACQETMTDVFLRGNEPYEYDEFYVEVPINRQNRLLATRYTPPEDVVNEVFLNLPAEAADWAAANSIEPLPTVYDPIRTKTQNKYIQIESPQEFQAFTGNEQIDIIVRLTLDKTPESMQVSVGAGMYPVQWTEICSETALENGQWLLCSFDSSELEPGLYSLRTAFTLPGQLYRAAETYFEVE